MSDPDNNIINEEMSEETKPLKQLRKPIPDCVNCNAPSCTGDCSGANCSAGVCSSGGCGAVDCSEAGCGNTTGNGDLLSPADFKFNEDREPRGKIFATNWLDDISTSADFPIVQVQFKNTRNGFYLNPQKLNLKIGDMVAVEASPGHDLGRITMVGPLVRMQMKKNRLDPETAELKKVFRIATPQDIERFEEARKREHDTMIRSRVIAEELGLDMKIGDVEYQGDGSKAIFYYIADERVDFRKLIRLLADAFHVRIEMKQIGARQEAGRIGGIGPCGRPLCCSSWMTHFVSVGTGAARMQDLSMNPQKLAGQCAKLKCCLNFELDTYAESVKKLPPKDVVLETKDGDFYYFKADILQRLITYSTDKRIPSNLTTIPAARAFEIIALNKQGVKVDQLLVEEDTEEQPKEYIDLTDQDSLTRFDKSKPRKKKNHQKGDSTPAKGENSKGENAKEEADVKEDSQPRQKQKGSSNTPKSQKNKDQSAKGEAAHQNKQINDRQAQQPKQKGGERQAQQPKQKGVEQQPKQKGVEQQPKQKGVEQQPKQKGESQQANPTNNANQPRQKGGEQPKQSKGEQSGQRQRHRGNHHKNRKPDKPGNDKGSTKNE